jgi:multidrug resistance protein
VRKRVLITLMGQIFLSILGLGIVGPVLPLYARSFGVSAAMAGGLITAFGLARMFTNIPAGRLSDRLGRRPLLIGGMLLISVASFFSATAQSFAPLIFFRLLQGVGSATQTTVALIALTDISTPRDRGRIMSLYMGGLLLGASLGPSVGGFVGEQWGFRAPFFVYSGLALIGALWGYLLAPETRPAAPQADARSGREPTAQRSSMQVLWSLLRNPSFVLVNMVTVMSFFTRSGGQSTVLPLYGDSIGLGAGQIGLVLSAIAGANLLTVRAAGSFADRYGRKRVILPAALISGVGLIAFTFSQSFATFIASGILLGIGSGFVGPAPAAYVADIARPGEHGMAMGLFKTFGDVGVTIGPLMMGWLVDRFSHGTALQVNAVMFAMAGLAFGLFAVEKTREQPGLATVESK